MRCDAVSLGKYFSTFSKVHIAFFFKVKPFLSFKVKAVLSFETLGTTCPMT
jgi:hypothetical protein